MPKAQNPDSSCRWYQATDSIRSSRTNTNMENSEKEHSVRILDVIGEKGRHQMLVACLCLVSNIVASWNVLGYTFFVYPMDYWCARPNGESFKNLSVAQWKNLSVITWSSNNYSSNCFMNEVVYDDDDDGFRRTGQTVKCEAWEFHDPLFYQTIISKWGLVCQNSWQMTTSQIVYMVGFMFSVFSFGQLGDRLGRRPVLLFGILVYLVAGLITSLANSFYFFVLCRFFVALGIHGTTMTAFVVLMEYLGSQYRPVYYLSLSLGWAVGYTTIPGLAYITRDWAYLQLSFVCFGLTLLPLWWYCLESPRWLLTQGHYESAESVMITVAQRNQIWNENRHGLIQEIVLLSDRGHKSRDIKKATLLDLFRTPNMRTNTLVMFYIWFTTSFVYYGMILNFTNFGVGVLKSTAISGALEFVSAAIGVLCFSCVLRRPTAITLFFGVAILFFTITGLSENLKCVRTTLAAIGKVLIEVAFDLIYIYSAEIFPTVVRNVAVGSSSTVAHVGSFIAPFMKDMIGPTGRSVPMAIFGVITTLAGFLVILLPETKTLELQDTLEEGEHVGKKTVTKVVTRTSSREVSQKVSNPSDRCTTLTLGDLASNSLI